MRVGIAGASGYAGAELLRLCAGHPDLDVVVAGADSQAGQALAALYPSLAAAYPRLEFSKVGRRRARRARRRLPGAAARRVPGAGPRPRGPGGRARRPVGRLPPARPRCLPAVVRRRARRTRAARRASPTGCPSCFAPICPGPRWWRPRGVTRLRPPWRSPLWCAPVSIETTGVVVDAASGVSGAGRTLDARHPLHHRGRGLHRLRAAHPPPHAGDRAGHRGPGAVHAAPGSDEPRHPGHLLRPAGWRPRHRRRSWGSCTTPTPTSRSWW